MVHDYFGDAVAREYDSDEASRFDPELIEQTAQVLVEQAAGGSALEFGVGTGRIAIPLAQRGVRVQGLDLSEAMLNQLRRKPGADLVPTTAGDFAHDRVDGSFDLVYLVFNTVMNLTTQQDQVACFRNAAAHLRPGGRFLIEVMIPQLQRLPPGESVRPFMVSATRLGFDEYDVAAQRLVSHHYRFSGEHVDAMSMPFRYVWPAELDLMAELAGMQLYQRWADWDRSEFTSSSEQHISIWQTAPSTSG